MRECVRAIVLTPEREILLMRIRKPVTGEYFWITPGGGREEGESVEQALRRELLEEVGLTSFEIGPLIWKRQHTFDWAGKRIRQNEQYYIVTAGKFEPKMSDQVEAAVLDCFRWWPLAELRGAADRLTPLSLADIVAGYVNRGGPPDHLATEILVD